jgi:hypothetical protein
VRDSGYFPEVEQQAFMAILSDQSLRPYKQVVRRMVGRLVTLTQQQDRYREARGLDSSVGHDARRELWARLTVSIEAERAYPLTEEERARIPDEVTRYTEPDIAWAYGLSRDRVRELVRCARGAA